MFLRLLKILSPFRSYQQPGIEATFADPEACCLAVASSSGRQPTISTVPTSTPLGSPFTSMPNLGDPGFFVGFDPVPPGVDVNPFPDIGSLGSDLDGLATQDDQLCPGLSDAEGSHCTPSFNPRRCRSSLRFLDLLRRFLPGRHSRRIRSSPRSSSSRRSRAGSAGRSGSRR